MAKISQALGSEFIWEDCNVHVFDALKAYGKDNSSLVSLGDEIANYVSACEKTIIPFAKNEDNKTQFLSEASACVVSLRITTDEAKPFVIDDNKLFMETKPNYWNSYLSEFSTGNLEKILGAGDAIPLITRKNIDKAKQTIAGIMQKISKDFGSDVTFEDNTQEVFDELKTYGRSEDQLYKMGDELVSYFQQIQKELTPFCKDADNLSQLQGEMSASVIGVKVGTSFEKPLALEDGKLFLQTKPNYWSSYLSEFTGANLEKILGLSDPIPLITRKNLAKSKKAIATSMEKINKAYGQELAWADNDQETYDALITYGKSKEDLYTLGDQILSYVKQAEKEMIAFCKDADNLEALQEELSGAQIGVKVVSEHEKPWGHEGGQLWMYTKPNYWNSYLNEFTASKLESIL